VNGSDMPSAIRNAKTVFIFVCPRLGAPETGRGESYVASVANARRNSDGRAALCGSNLAVAEKNF
jgi:hypothetical protein